VGQRLASSFGVSGGFAREWLLPSPTMPRHLWAPALGLAYIATIAVFGGLRPDHVMVGLMGFLDLYNRKTRLFLRTFLPFIATGVIFDSMRYFLVPLIDGRVHVAGPYLLDRHWFGVGGRTLNEWFLDHHWTIVDLAAGFAYLTYVAEYIALAILLFFRGRAQAAGTFARCFLVVNVLGFITYFVFPAAPPWYVHAHGFAPALIDAQPSAAAALRFDALLGTHVFNTMYARGIAVYGAIPSLHVAYPLMAAVLAFRIPALRWARWPAVLFSALVCFSAVYLQHHYVIDVLLGLSYALITLAVVLAWERRYARPTGEPQQPLELDPPDTMAATLSET
jgi:membrane-associated phospholipid phosphatase